MKKRFGIAVMILALLTPALQAQEESYKKNEIGINAGFFSTSGGIRYGIGGFGDIMDGFYYGGNRNIGINLYGHYGMHYYHQLLRWLQLGVKATVEPMSIKQYEYGSKTKLAKETQKVFATLMPSVRFTYINKPKFRLYSGVDMGLRYYSRHDNNYKAEAENSAVEESRVQLISGAVNVTPIGMTFGSKLYGLFETNLGFDALLKIGIGYRF